MESAPSEVVAATPVVPPTPLTPVGDSERIELLDILRGFAVFGILLVNIGSYAHPFAIRFPEPAPGDAGSAVALWLTRAFAEGKFYPLFSMLFGLGLALQMDRAARAGREGFPRLYARRLFVLAGIGLFHGLFIWAGDILFTYALLGFVLLAVRNVKPRNLLITASALLLAPFVLCGAGAGVLGIALSAMKDRTAFDKFAARMIQDTDAAYAAYSGSFGEIALRRLSDWFSLQTEAAGAMTGIFAMFVVGLWAGRRGLASASEEHVGFLRKTAWIALPAGFAGAVFYASVATGAREILSSPWPLLGLAVNFPLGAALAVGYAALMALLLRRDGARRLLRVLAPAGRMALTNYLLQSVICTFLFYGYGLGLFGTTTALTGALTALAVFGFQLVLSHAWLRRFRYGPVEWLWRSLTYGARQPMRREPLQLAPAPQR